MAFLVATTSLPAVDRPNADRWNAARSRQKSSQKLDIFRSKAPRSGSTDKDLMLNEEVRSGLEKTQTDEKSNSISFQCNVFSFFFFIYNFLFVAGTTRCFIM